MAVNTPNTTKEKKRKKTLIPKETEISKTIEISKKINIPSKILKTPSKTLKSPSKTSKSPSKTSKSPSKTSKSPSKTSKSPEVQISDTKWDEFLKPNESPKKIDIIKEKEKKTQTEIVNTSTNSSKIKHNPFIIDGRFIIKKKDIIIPEFFKENERTKKLERSIMHDMTFEEANNFMNRDEVKEINNKKKLSDLKKDNLFDSFLKKKYPTLRENELKNLDLVHGTSLKFKNLPVYVGSNKESRKNNKEFYFVIIKDTKGGITIELLDESNKKGLGDFVDKLKKHKNKRLKNIDFKN